MKEWKKPEVEEVAQNDLDKEVSPASYLHHGEIRTINDEIAYHEGVMAQRGVNPLHVEVYDLGPLHNAHQEGFDYVMRLPRENVAGCIANYGRYYEMLESYVEFVKTLAARNGVTELKVISGPLYVFRTKEDAETVRTKLIEQQQKAELEFGALH